MPIDLHSARNANPNAQPAASVNAGVESGLHDYMRAIYNYMAGGLALTGMVAWYASVSGLYLAIAKTPLIWVVLFAPLAMVLFLGFRIQKMSLATAQVTYWIYAALMGLSLAGIFMLYTGESIARVFFITAGTFGGMSVYGYTTKTDLTRFRSFLYMGLFGVIIAMVVNMFLHSSALQFAVSVIGVIVFVGLTAYDTQKIKALYAAADARDTFGKKVVMGALTLYLDFVNLFLMLLRLFGGRR
ncbi:MAG TPA: Bax inhibitor-1/YccA family protein [Stenotrophobium sp.]|jgi:FtsH-binding integral membrane protein|nr:Bax inhibitor-1/YccA family protein [Stenotrophobium sp.]